MPTSRAARRDWNRCRQTRSDRCRSRSRSGVHSRSTRVGGWSGPHPVAGLTLTAIQLQNTYSRRRAGRPSALYTVQRRVETARTAAESGQTHDNGWRPSRVGSNSASGSDQRCPILAQGTRRIAQVSEHVNNSRCDSLSNDNANADHCQIADRVSVRMPNFRTTFRWESDRRDTRAAVQ